jgi:hypothetical protein
MSRARHDLCSRVSIRHAIFYHRYAIFEDFSLCHNDKARLDCF